MRIHLQQESLKAISTCVKIVEHHGNWENTPVPFSGGVSTVDSSSLPEIDGLETFLEESGGLAQAFKLFPRALKLHKAHT